MMSQFPPIRRVAPEYHEAALRLLLSDIPAHERSSHVAGVLQYVTAGRGTFDLLLASGPGPRPLGVILAMVQPGQIAIVWPPRVQMDAPPELGDALLAAALAGLEPTDCVLAQAQLEPYSADKFPLERAGFQQVGDLLFMSADASQFPRVQLSATVSFEPYHAGLASRLAGIIEATYEGTLDCPSLNGVRRVEDVLAGYAEVGDHDPADWFIVRRGDDDAGCLLLAQHRRQRQMELIYMGVLPGHRGYALGEELVRHALWHAGQTGMQVLSLAVDAGNRPALRMYASCGLLTWQRRWTFLKLFADGT